MARKDLQDPTKEKPSSQIGRPLQGRSSFSRDLTCFCYFAAMVWAFEPEGGKRRFLGGEQMGVDPKMGPDGREIPQKNDRAPLHVRSKGVFALGNAHETNPRS